MWRIQSFYFFVFQYLNFNIYKKFRDNSLNNSRNSLGKFDEILLKTLLNYWENFLFMKFPKNVTKIFLEFSIHEISQKCYKSSNWFFLKFSRNFQKTTFFLTNFTTLLAIFTYRYLKEFSIIISMHEKLFNLHKFLNFN